MKLWQRYWLWFAFLFSTLHLTRDVLQNIGVMNFFTTTFAKTTTAAPLWLEATALTSELLNVIVSLYCLINNTFGRFGLATFILFGIFASMWAYFTFIL
ncbi:hypothetical protein C4579_04155 [Candidatus Microgenomates bacterium]|nr:MAG: hypothetical protein C4579_04155 [Candidatus Microgenomates bacterium]